jgi:hypothetical protein
MLLLFSGVEGWSGQPMKSIELPASIKIYDDLAVDPQRPIDI